MNMAYIECDYIDTKFVLVSWDVGRPGLWYGVERFGTFTQPVDDVATDINLSESAAPDIVLQGLEFSHVQIHFL